MPTGTWVSPRIQLFSACSDHTTLDSQNSNFYFMDVLFHRTLFRAVFFALGLWMTPTTKGSVSFDGNTKITSFIFSLTFSISFQL